MATQKSQLEASKLLGPAELAAAVKAEAAKVDDLCLDFTLPGQPEWELKPGTLLFWCSTTEFNLNLLTGGKGVSVTLSNLPEYIALVCETFLSRGVAPQLSAFAAGFDEIFPVRHLHGFTVSELVLKQMTVRNE